MEGLRGIYRGFEGLWRDCEDLLGVLRDCGGILKDSPTSLVLQVIVREAKEGSIHPLTSSSPCPVHGLLMQAKAGSEGEEEVGKERWKAKKAEEEEELEMTECSDEIITYQPVAKNKFRLSKVIHFQRNIAKVDKPDRMLNQLFFRCQKMMETNSNQELSLRQRYLEILF